MTMAVEVSGFARESFTHDGIAHDVYRAGTGPAVVVLHEIPGLHPGVIDFARRVIAEGFTVYVPSLFGHVGEPFAAKAIAPAIVRTCISREFAMFVDRTSPVNTWLRALASKAHGECGGAGVGAIGMCFTGGFALAMAVEPAVLGSVMSQPSLPIGFTAAKRAALGLDAEDRACIAGRARSGALRVLGLRFTEDPACPGVRFATLRRELGDAFEGIEIDSSRGNAHGIPKSAHCVLTMELVDQPGHPTREALERVMSFFRERLKPRATA